MMSKGLLFFSDRSMVVILHYSRKRQRISRSLTPGCEKVSLILLYSGDEVRDLQLELPKSTYPWWMNISGGLQGKEYGWIVGLIREGHTGEETHIPIYKSARF